MAVTGVATRQRVAQQSWTQRGIGAWLTTTDHKRIGLMYMFTAFAAFLVGGLEAELIRTQLAAANLKVLNPEAYDQVFTMHATTMIFLFVMPMSTGIGNFVVPLMIGAKDMAFPRINALGYWLVLIGAVFLTSSFVFGAAPNAGWFSYAPLTECTPAQLGGAISQQSTLVQANNAAHSLATCFAPGPNMDFWIIGLNLLGIASLTGAINFIVTILRMRAPGMTLNRMPLFCWMMLVTSFLLAFALPSITVASFFLLFDRHLGTHFYQSASGGDTLLWQHLFWSFGHPEVYILILPAFGIISEVLPVFSGKPIFGYTFIAWSGVAIGFLSFTVWAHHMFAVGLPTAAQAFFASSTTLIAIPTAVKIFNWVATVYGGRIRFNVPMLFALGFVAMFLIGGLNGAALAIVPFDYQVTDTYFVVSHIHYVLFGGAAMGIFAGLYYWWPKFFGRQMSEGLGQIHFWLWLIGLNLAFFPMHILGLLGMPRRQYTFPTGEGWDALNGISTVGAYLLAVGTLFFIWNAIASFRKPATAPNDPWDANTLEWATTSPPPPHNFDSLPRVRSTRPLWDVKHPEDPDWRRAH